MFNDLIETLHKKGFQVFAYADDLAITGKGRKGAEEAIEAVEEWTRSNRMTINKKKSGIIFIRKERRAKKSKKNKNNRSETFQ